MSDQKGWSYRLDETGAAVEYAVWSGGATPALGMHFHDEAQLAFVLAGGRLFEIGARAFAVEAGQCLCIPARLPHRGLPARPGGARCLNIYVSLPFVFAPCVLDIPAPAGRPASDLLRDVEKRLVPTAEAPPMMPRGDELGRPVSEIARRHGLSREGFSRRFARETGMPPHAWHLVARLNEARRRLRAGDSVADVAADFGFADQSHFGRHFRRVFGVSPRAYREDLRWFLPPAGTKRRAGA